MENIEQLSLIDLTNAINNAFSEPMQELTGPFPNDYLTNRVSDQFHDIITPWETYKKLNSLSVSEAPDPDKVSGFVF